MRVLHLIPSFGTGGAERQLSILAPVLAESGIECHVGYCYEGPNLQFLAGSSVYLHHFKVAGNHDPRLFWQVWSLIRAVKPDVVQTWLLQMDVLGGVAALLKRTPFIISERASAAAYPLGGKTRLRALIGRYATCIVANSECGLDYWRPRVSAERLHLVRNAISRERMGLSAPILEESFPIILEGPIVLFAGRFTYQKNIPVLVEALIAVARQQQNAVFLLFGEGPERELAARKIADEGLGGRMVLPGYSSNLAHWMRRAAVCVSLSHFEGLPNVAIEAAEVGCPLVLSDIPEHREIFDQSSAWFVKHKSVDEVKDGILRALREKGESSAKAERAKRVVANFTPDAVLAEYLGIYSDVMNLKCRDTGETN
jgi:glycosyltransferase involved in cell wall biosynthesis